MNDILPNDNVSYLAKQPSIQDPKLWLIKCKLGTERECVNNLFHKYFAMESSSNKNSVDKSLK